MWAAVRVVLLALQSFDFLFEQNHAIAPVESPSLESRNAWASTVTSLQEYRRWFPEGRAGEATCGTSIRRTD